MHCSKIFCIFSALLPVSGGLHARTLGSGTECLNTKNRHKNTRSRVVQETLVSSFSALLPDAMQFVLFFVTSKYVFVLKSSSWNSYLLNSLHRTGQQIFIPILEGRLWTVAHIYCGRWLKLSCMSSCYLLIFSPVIGGTRRACDPWERLKTPGPPIIGDKKLGKYPIHHKFRHVP